MARPIRALIVDDEPLARRGLEIRLRDAADVEIVGQCSHGAEAVALVEALRPDLMFLDVQMPGMDGFATLQSIPAEQRPLVVFVTAFDHHAVRAFDACALDYLLKPVDETRLAQSLERVREALADRGAEAQRERLLALLRQVSGQPDLELDELMAEGESRLRERET
ncbi:MAG TPA: response regulator, partial [Vicinamibacterales bacterium]|nr:response regulator [Vicinamibacterales bacterium]